MNYISKKISKKSKGTLFVLTVNARNYHNNLFYDELRRGINIAANLKGINVEFYFGFKHCIDSFAEANGIIFAPDGSRENYDLISKISGKFHIPIVQVDNLVEKKALAPSFDAFIGIDNMHGGAVIAKYLKSYLPPRSRILIISGHKELDFLSYNRRMDGFVRESKDYFQICDVVYGEFDHRIVYNRLSAYLASKQYLPEAIFALNDDSAIVARKVLDELGIKKEILITGFDGSAAGRVALSQGKIICSYDQNPEELGRQAVDLFINIISRKRYAKCNLLQSELLTRQNIGNTFQAGVINFLDRTLDPISFRKRRYQIFADKGMAPRTLSAYKNELICPIIIGTKKLLSGYLRQIEADKHILLSDNDKVLRSGRAAMKTFLQGEGLVISELGFAGGEKHKTPAVLMELLENILSKQITKKSCLILLGGGITGNVGGLAASLLYRGIRFVHIPTTLMHMVDSSTGGKQAVNSRLGKNAIGSFWEPEFIFIEPQFLRSLPEKEMINGMAESIKHALCQDRKLYDFILNHCQKLRTFDFRLHKSLIDSTLRLKLNILEKDSYELNEGMVLVYGHTLGNAIESASDFALSHGEAISIGMVAAAMISEELGLAGPELVIEHKTILQSFGLPVELPRIISRNKVFSYLKYDKKHTDCPLSFILLSRIGEVYMKNGQVPVKVDGKIIKKVLYKL